MNRPRQDAWTKDEDILLAEIVLRHIRSGKTQLEAFKKAGEALSRTPAACGFRWNASLRKQHTEAINSAKNNHKQSLYETATTINLDERHTIESAISMLERVKNHVGKSQASTLEEQQQVIFQLQEENKRLEEEVKRYREAWTEMNSLWEWIENKNEH